MKLYFAFTCGWFIILFLNALLAAHIRLLKGHRDPTTVKILNAIITAAFMAVPTYFFYTYLLEH